jgi:hypothetical protein
VWVQIRSVDGKADWISDRSFTLDGTETFVRVYVQVGNGNTVDHTIYPMLNAGSEVFPFEEPKKQSFSLPHTLHAIPVSSGGNYTDADGQQWIADEVDLERGVRVQRLELKTFILSKSAYEFTPLGYRYQHHAGNGFTLGNTCLCKTMPYNNEVGTDVTTTDGVRINKDAGYIIAQYTDESGTAETISLDILYILPEPIETPLTAEENEAFKAMRTNYLTTTVLNTAGTWMELSYNADTKAYIDGKVTLVGNMSVAHDGNGTVTLNTDSDCAMDSVVLVDQNTGKKYKLAVVDGKLSTSEAT